MRARADRRAGPGTLGAARPGLGDLAPRVASSRRADRRMVRIAARCSCRVSRSSRSASATCSTSAPASSGDAVGGGWIGYLSYPDPGADGHGPRIPEAAGGWTDGVLRQDSDGTWWYESLSGAAAPTWVTEALLPRRAEAALPRRLGPRRPGHPSGAECWPASTPSQRARCTRPVCARSSSVTSAVRQSTSSPRPWRAPRLPVRRSSPGLGRGRVALTRTVPAARWRRGRLEPHQGHAADRRGTFGAARIGQGRRREHHDRRPGPQRPRPRRGHRKRHRARTAGGAPAPGVWHLVSTVSARVDTAVPIAAVLDATFPPASVTGTPKRRARELLAGWEPVRRGIYCGTVGLASPVAGTELNVAIRTVEFDGTGARGARRRRRHHR